MLGESYLQKLRQAYLGQVFGLADLVSYWFVKSAHLLKMGEIQYFGLVSTNSIRDVTVNVFLQLH